MGLGSDSGADGSSNALPTGVVRPASVDTGCSVSEGDVVTVEGTATDEVVTGEGGDETGTWDDSPEEAAPQAAMKRAKAKTAMARNMVE